jgi:hypothetical protein
MDIRVQPRKHPHEQRFSIDYKAIAAYREQLRAMCRGVPLAEAAVADFSDWEVVEAIERLWSCGALPREDRARVAR